ncbi:hypothetical protein KUTeg_007477 [Tegillarca granosa]|uniref:VWFA domain-containing protein n=1 Tax=Tegillarca granosa TaxID=220873 RepID=A0ABQ9FHE6_TEGGR|nr:hypothetical protein KUTeg_007477 [Tegillarca granosa]
MEISHISRPPRYLFKTGNICSTAQVIDGAAFTNVLQSIANNALGVAKVQNLHVLEEDYDKVIYRNTFLDGGGLVTEISSSLSRKFNGPIQALKKIKEAVEQDINSYTTTRTLKQCCQATGINTNEACVTISSDSPPGSTFPNTRIQEVMKENYRQNPNLKWQYFGKEDGVYVNYPSVKLSDCSNYDPRYRPFYVSTATPVEKDVVVVIDRSGSMGDYHDSRSLLQIAKEAAISVLDTLNPNDRFGVVAFDTNAYIPGANTNQRSCHETKLAHATPLNIKYMKNQIREKVILFLTDGEKTAGGDPLVTIKDSNKKLNNEVTILTYGLGTVMHVEEIGRFEHIKNASYLRSAMASYYNRFSSSETVTNPIFSVPYQDLFGIGLITSICLPLYSSQGLFGVACSDATLSDIVADISYFRQGEYSYAFIIDGFGRTLMHPMLPLPYSIKDDPIYVDIKNLERSPMAAGVISSMVAYFHDFLIIKASVNQPVALTEVRF